MKRVFCALLLSIVITAFSSGQESGSDILKMAPGADRDYRCEDMVRAVNKLRQLGKDRALAAMEAYCKQSQTGNADIKVIMITKLLFVNPAGWPSPILGRPFPLVKTNGLAQFPIFPLAIYDGVPFLLVEGYEGEGLFDSPFAALNACKSLSMITNDLPETNFEMAAHGILTNSAFMSLYDDRDYIEMTAFIHNQAGRR